MRGRIDAGRRQYGSRQTRAKNEELAALERYLARNLFSWIRADYWAENAGKVTAFWDKVALESEGAVAPNARSVDPAHALSQGSVPLQVAVPSSDSRVQNQRCATFARSVGNRYDSSIAGGSWKFIHDGTGAEAWLAGITTAVAGIQTHWGTRNTSGAGISVIRNITTPASQTMYVLTATNTFVVQSTVGGGVWADNAPFFVSQRFSGGTPNWAHQYKGSVVASGAKLATPDPGAASSTLSLGSDGTNHADFLFADLLIVNRVDAKLRATVQRYFQLRYGLT